MKSEKIIKLIDKRIRHIKDYYIADYVPRESVISMLKGLKDEIKKS